MRVTLDHPGMPSGGTYPKETVEIDDRHVAALLGTLIPFARLYGAEKGAPSPPWHERLRVVAALEKVGLKVRGRVTRSLENKEV